MVGGDRKLRVVFACPTYGPTDSVAIRSQRAAIMFASRHSVDWVGDASPERMKFDAARNTVVRSVLNNTTDDEVDYIFWCDSDIVLPVEAINRMVVTRHDFVTGIYCQRYAPHWPLIAYFSKFGGRDGKGAFSWFTEWPRDTVAPIDACGFGCVLTSTRMLRGMTDPWFAYEKFSEDFDFCLKAKRHGHQLYVDTGVLCGHLADPQPIGVEDFFRHRVDAIRAEEAKQTQAQEV